MKKALAAIVLSAFLVTATPVVTFGIQPTPVVILVAVRQDNLRRSRRRKRYDPYH